MSETRNDAVQIVRDGLCAFADDSRAALDRIEAVVGAARAVKGGAPVTLLDAALASLTQETPAQEERT